MWPFSERRRHKRYAVSWDAALTCVFANLSEKLDVKVLDISPGGARIKTSKMQLGSYHLFVDNHVGELELAFDLPEGLFISKVATRWFNWDDVERVFVVGVEFVNTTEESRSKIAEIISSL